MCCRADLMASVAVKLDAQGNGYGGGALRSVQSFELWELQGHGSRDQRVKGHRFDGLLGLILELGHP